MAQPAVRADLHQALDVLGALAAEVALHGKVVVDLLAELADLVVGEVLHVRVGVDPGVLEDLPGHALTDAVDVGETYLDALVQRDVYSGYTCHSLPLTLLVTRVLADDEHGAVASDDLALLAHGLDRGSDLHGSAIYSLFKRQARGAQESAPRQYDPRNIAG